MQILELLFLINGLKKCKWTSLCTWYVIFALFTHIFYISKTDKILPFFSQFSCKFLQHFWGNRFTCMLTASIILHAKMLQNDTEHSDMYTNPSKNVLSFGKKNSNCRLCNYIVKIDDQEVCNVFKKYTPFFFTSPHTQRYCTCKQWKICLLHIWLWKWYFA